MKALAKVKPKVPKDVRSKKFQEWVADIQQKMHLGSYKVVISDEPCAEDSNAEVFLDDYRRINISLSRNWGSLTRVEKRDVVVHELCHVAFELACRPYKAFEGTVASEAWAVVEAEAIISQEESVSLMEWTISPFMPLPPEE